MVAPTPIAEFDGEIKGIRTMANGDPRFTFEAQESGIEVMSALARAQKEQFLHVMVFDANEWMEYLQTEMNHR